MVIKFSKKGQYHKEANVENQDFVYSYENANICYIAIADGASSCKKGKQGAEIACKCIKKLLVDSDIFSFDEDKIAYVIWEEIMYHIKNEAVKQKTTPKMFASTFAFACFDKRTDTLITYNLGDGVIFVKYDSEYKMLSAPKRFKGKCTLVPNTDAFRDADVTFTEFFKGSVFLCTDGLYTVLSDNKIKVEDIIKEPDKFDGVDDMSFILFEDFYEVSEFEKNFKTE